MKYVPCVIGALLLASCAPPPPSTDMSLVSPTGEILHFSVEVADDEAERTQGLMERSSLPERGGMLFVFNDVAVRSFWMKNTRIPLDIAFFDADGAFVSMMFMEPCTDDPCPTFLSEKPAAYALETAAGDLIGRIGEGWTLDLPRR